VTQPPPSKPAAAPRQDVAPLTEEQRLQHFLSRFTLGGTPELMAEVRAAGISNWLGQQLEGGSRLGSQLARRLAKLGSLGLTSGEILQRYNPTIVPSVSPEKRRELQRARNTPARELRDSVLLSGVYSQGQVREVAADFFRNHFCVAVDKGSVKFYATEYEREVIRARVFGSFRDMLGASAKHPAMLEFLDNALSRRPPSKAELKAIEMRIRQKTRSKQQGLEASSIAAQRGLNENYARELLELHTLGVDNYYKQADVENVARVLTGWTIKTSGPARGTFVFEPKMHSGKDKRVLRTVIKGDNKDPQQEGERLLDLLAKHEGTADYLAWKLCRFLVHDEPDSGLVHRIAKVFRRSKGDLPTVYGAIVADEEFFAPRNYRAKFKRPFEFVVSALRATRAEIEDCGWLHKALAAMNESLYLCKDPTGYYDQAEAWLDPGAFAIRWKFARDLVTGKIKGVRVPASIYSDLGELPPERWKPALIERILPGGLGARSAAALDSLSRAEFERAGGPRLETLAPTMIGVLLGSPEFQRQ
jgi:uncharacterized protein (DUF1800 family)